MYTIGIIGGSGVYDMPGIELVKNITLDTPYGAPSGAYSVIKISGREAVFLPRHGSGHSIAPHRVNYRANLWGFKELGVCRILSTGAVGGINRLFNAGDIAIADQLIDMTKGRESTFYNEGKVYHVDFTSPYCPQLRQAFIDGAKSLNFHVHTRGTYVCTEGPRLESAAEIRFYSIIGADMVGMTAMPEAQLARELEICYSTVAVITNPAAGIAADRLTVTEVMATMKESSERLNALIARTISVVTTERRCSCGEALKDAGM
ncbi:MAG: S-methyl-5'-thioadenosine phosphorylase [Nitrospirae bacterium]|nr:S-methyl-5'-thioadenosine phosphorylase [Nitrospirota bacterium]